MSAPTVLHVTTAGASSNATTFAVTIPASAAGSTFVIVYVPGNNDATLTSVTGGSGSWSQKQVDGNGLTCWGVLSGVAAGTTTFTFNLSLADGPTVAIYELGNTSGVIDQQAAVKMFTSVTTVTSNTINTTDPLDLIIGAIFGWPPGGVAVTVTPSSSGYTNEANFTNTFSGKTFLQTGRQTTAATGTFGYNATTSAAVTGGVFVISVRGPVAASQNFGGGFSDGV